MRKLLLLFIVMLSTATFAQNTLKGSVVDSETNIPLAGANVVENGTSNGTITDLTEALYFLRLQHQEH